MITVKDWGTTPSGEQILQYILHNTQGTEVRLTNVGAAICGVRFADRNGNLDEVLLGYANGKDYIGDVAVCGKSVGRVANRIKLGHLEVEGKVYQLEINNLANHLHGGTGGYANLIWQSKIDGNGVVFSLHSPDGDQNYPSAVDVQVKYWLTDDNELVFTYDADSDGTTPFMLTNHAYWNLSGESSGDILDHELMLHSSQALEMTIDHIPTGKIIDIIGTPLDFTSWRRFGDDITAEYQMIDKKGGYGHYLPLDNWQKGELREIGMLRSKNSGRMVQFLSTQAGCMVYTGNRLSINCPETISGGRYADHAGVAIECQGFVDAVNNPHFPSIMLHKGEHYYEKTIYKFITE
jgi:aldose 1-epimerase